MMEMVQNGLGKLCELAKPYSEKIQEKKQWCQNNWKNFNGKQGQKEARAVCQRKPEQVLQIAPGMTQIVELEVLNDTYWPWVTGCTLTLADEQPGNVLPVEIFKVPIE